LTITIEIRELRPVSLRGGVLIDCTRTANGDGPIEGSFLVDQLGLELIGVIDSDEFPPVGTVINSKPNFPMRIYADTESKIAVISSDFGPSEHVLRPLGRSILAWARRQAFSLIITTCWSGPSELGGDIAGAYSTENARLRLEQSRISYVGRAQVFGLPAILLNEGSWGNMDVIAIITSSPTGASQLSTSEKIIAGIDVLLPEVKFRSFAPSLDKDEQIALSTRQSSAKTDRTSG
jgi:uncharacterized protein